METLGLVLLKSAAWLTGFTLVFLLVLRNERYFRLNRFYLLTGIIASLLFPFYTFHYTVVLPSLPLDTASVGQLTAGAVVSPAETPALPVYFWIYLAGIIVLMFRLLFQTWRIIRKLQKVGYEKTGAVKLVRTSEYLSSFSFFSFVFVNPSIASIEVEEIMNHEREHIQQRHWFDLLLVELLCIVQWFNPFAWIYAHLVRQNHEYLADESALQRTADPAIYQATLLNQLLGDRVFSLTNSFSYSMNKKRFKMMKKKIDSPFRKLKMLVVLPLVALLFYAFATPDYRYDNVGSGSVSDGKTLYSVGKDNIDIEFTTQYSKSDLDALKSDLATLGIEINFFSTKFSKDGKLSQISAEIVYPSGGKASLKSNNLPNERPGPGFHGDPNGSFSSGYLNKIDIKGQVVKSDGKPLYGTSVVVRGSTVGTITNPEGKFELKDVPSDGELVFSFVGFKTVVRKITNQPMKIVMEVGNVGIDQVTVVGYGTPPPPPPPLDVTKELESPNPPLVFLDGVQITKEEMNQINSSEVASISIEKNKSCTELYGTKAKNGVVLIVTKKKTSNIQQLFCNYAEQMVEVMPQFPGGQQALNDFFASVIAYPAEAVKNNIQGRVLVTFTVNSDGTVGNAKISRGVNPLLDNEAIRVVNLLPNWTPGKNKGLPVTASYTIPVQFALDGGKAKQSVSNVKPRINEKGEKEVFVVVEEMPEYPGGAIALRNFIAKEIKYPEDAKKEKIQGKVFVSFVVSSEGKVGLAKIEKSVNPALDAEAMRVISIMPDWKPGKQRGQAVSVAYTIPIQFALQ